MVDDDICYARTLQGRDAEPVLPQMGNTRAPDAPTHTSRAGTIPTPYPYHSGTLTARYLGPGLVSRPPCGLTTYPLNRLSRERCPPKRNSASSELMDSVPL